MNEFFYDSYSLILFFLLPGVFLGMVYDVFRILRIARHDPEEQIIGALYRHFRIEKISYIQNEKKRHMIEYALVFTEDFLFCIIAALTELLLFYHLNGGVIRIYGFWLSAIGFFLYRMSFGRFVMYMAKHIIRLANRILYLVLVVLLTPILWFIGKFKKHWKSKCLKRKRKVKKKHEA